MKKKLLIISMVLFAVSSVFLTIESVTSGAEVSSLEQKESALLAQKRELDEDLVKAVSISDLEEKGQELGYTKASNIIYLGQNANVANLQQ
ncbi:MAG: hypothetical protein ACHQUA_01510 [Microgenomates group bacterium]